MKNTESVVLGGGCFWCLEAAYKQFKGVVEAIPGYAGGAVPNPTYDEVSMGTTGHVEVVKELLKTQIDIDHVNNLGWTALLEAIVLSDGGPRHQEIVRLLVSAGADINLSDRQGVTPLQHARRSGFEVIANVLESHGAR